jgi:hypothetical protein
MRFRVFPELSKLDQSWKLKMDSLPCFKNSQFFHEARLGIINNFLHFTNNQFSIELELKILE